MGFTHSSRGERAALQSSEPSSRKGSGSREREKLLSTFPPCRGRSVPALAWPCQPSVPPGEGLGSERGDPVPNPSRGRFLASPRSRPSFWGHAAAASHWPRWLLGASSCVSPARSCSVPGCPQPAPRCHQADNPCSVLGLSPGRVGPSGMPAACRSVPVAPVASWARRALAVPQPGPAGCLLLLRLLDVAKETLGFSTDLI